MTVNIDKAELSKLVDQLAPGEEVTLERAGRPVAKLVRLEQTHGRRIIGSAQGEFVVPDDFNDPLPKEIEDTFYE